jgi:hypothetical protein
VAAFTAIAGVERADEQVLDWLGLPLTSRLAIWLIGDPLGMMKSGIQPKSFCTSYAITSYAPTQCFRR